jgi:hypothetical protein
VRNRLAAAGVGIGIGIGLATGCTEAPKPEASPVTVVPTTMREAAPIDELNKRVGDITQYIGPFAVDWAKCPEGGEVLDKDTNINAFVFNNGAYGPRADGGQKIYHTVQIKDVSQYRDAQGNIAAWCGTNVAEYPQQKSVQGPDAEIHPDAIIIIPTIPGCVQPEVKDGGLKPLPCPGMPLTVYEGPHTGTPGTVELLPPDPTTTLDPNTV